MNHLYWFYLEAKEEFPKEKFVHRDVGRKSTLLWGSSRCCPVRLNFALLPVQWRSRRSHTGNQEISYPTTFISTALPRKDSLRQPRLQFHLVLWIDDICDNQKIRPKKGSPFNCDIKDTKQGTRDPYVLCEAECGPMRPCLRTVSITQLAGAPWTSPAA